MATAAFAGGVKYTPNTSAVMASWLGCAQAHEHTPLNKPINKDTKNFIVPMLNRHLIIFDFDLQATAPNAGSE
jgi:hypothetical protein